ELICEALRRQILFRRRLGERETEAQLIAALKAQAVASGSQRWQAEALEAEAAYLVLLSRYDRARATLAQALELRRVLDDRNGQVACYCMLAEVAIHQGCISEARELLDRANSFPESLADRALVAQTVSTAAGAAIAHQDFGTSYALGQQMLELCAAIGDREGEADARARIATAATRLFRIQEALDHYDKAREIYTALGKRQGEAAVLLNAGGLAARLGRYAEALDAFNQAEALFGELSDLRGQAASALNSAYTALLTSDYQAGKAAALRGLKLARMMEHRAFEATALANLGAAERELGKLPRAVAHMQAGLAIRRELGQPANLASDLCDLTIAYLRAGDLALARQASDEMLAIHAAEQISDPQRVLWAAAQTYRALSDAPRAQELLAQAHAALQQQADAVPDPESRATFMELPFNSEILAAYGSDMWPGNAPC
ncbi:MAG TPA: tetratricopeptide repeat protein, partial [Roseiflexaceae bacterium]